MLTDPGSLSLPKEITILASAFFPKLPNQEPNDPSDWIILDIWVLLSFISWDIVRKDISYYSCLNCC